jgi:hypothetical protein
MIAQLPFPKGTTLIAGLLCCLCPGTRADPMPGAVDTFPDQLNGDAWRVYDYADGKEYLPDWYDVSDPFVGLTHVDDSPLHFFAGAGVADAAFVGDYTRDDILAIGVDFFIDNGFGFIDCAVFTHGPFGLAYYYSYPIYAEEHPEGGWIQVDFRFDEPWYYWNSTAEEFVAVQVDGTFLAGIGEIGFRFFPEEGNTATTVAALDNVAMVPTVLAPRLEPALIGNQFRISFTPNPGNQCDLLRYVPGLVNPWPEVAGQTHITGPGVHHYTTPLTLPSALFRVRAMAHYIEVFTSP